MACGELLAFDEVARLLGLGTRVDGGREEIQVLDIVGSVGRAREFDGCFRPRTVRLRRVLDQIRSTRPEAADMAISVYRVDHAYFVLDGHKRVSLAISQGRQFIDAEVTVFPTRFRVDAKTTIRTVRATHEEKRFRDLVLLELGQLLRSLGVIGIEPWIRCSEFSPAPVSGRPLAPTLSSRLHSPI